jgi:hypothetical protein
MNEEIYICNHVNMNNNDNYNKNNENDDGDDWCVMIEKSDNNRYEKGDDEVNQSKHLKQLSHQNQFIKKNVVRTKSYCDQVIIPNDDETILIIYDDIEKYDDIELLEKSASITKNVKYFISKKNSKDIKKIIPSLKNLSNIIKEIIDRHSIELDVAIENKKKSISRNSYKFCDYGYNCKYNYCKQNKCYAQHFVYDVVYNDIIDTIKYLVDNDIYELDELKTSINTMTYVISHMHDELNNLKKNRSDVYDNYVNKEYKLKKNVKNIKHQKKKI